MEKVNNASGIGHEVADFSPREHGIPPPSPASLIERLERLVAVFSKWTTIVAGIALTVMLAVSVVDVVGNKVFNRPVQGTSDYLSFLALITVAFALSYALVEKAHVQVDLFINKLPPRARAGVMALVDLLGTGLFLFLTWASIRYGIELLKNHTLSMTQRIPVSPFVFALAFACLPACLYLFLEFLRTIKKLISK